MALNNNQVYTVVNAAYNQALGKAAIAVEDLEGFVDTGSNTYAQLVANKDQFTQALIAVLAKNWFTDTSYRSQYNDPFYQDEREFGAIIQSISVTAPEVQEASNWETFTSGTTQLGTYTLYIPLVDTKYYGKTTSWQLPIAITDAQWDDAFRSGEDLERFVAYVLMVVDNAIVVHLENMNNLNRNNYIAEKIHYSEGTGATGVQVINLIDAYNTDRGGNITTVEQFLSDPEALRYAASTIDEYSTYFSKMSTLFNTGGKARFTPDDRKVIQVVKKFAKAIQEVSLSGAFNAQYVELPGYQEIPFWQGFGEGLTWNDVTSINVELGSDGTAVNKSGVVALIVDKWAIMHTIRKHRVGVTRFDPEEVTQYYYQFRDSYMNDLTMNGLVFVLENPTP